MVSSRRHLSHARGYLELGMIKEAKAALGRIPPAESDTLEVLAVRLALLEEMEDWVSLRRFAGKFVDRAPGDAGGWITWAYATRRVESVVAAERILLDAEKHHPSEPTIQFNLGCYACLNGDLPLARRRIDRAIALDPKFANLAKTDPDLAALRAVQSRGKSA